MDAEREIAKVYTAIFLKDHLGETFTGHIAHVTKQGLVVELDQFFIEGWAPKTALGTERYRFDERQRNFIGRRSGRTLGIGDPVEIEVADISTVDREIRFKVVS